MFHGNSILKAVGHRGGAACLAVVAAIILVLSGCASADRNDAGDGKTSESQTSVGKGQNSHEAGDSPGSSATGEADRGTSDNQTSIAEVPPLIGEREGSRRYRGNPQEVIQAGQLTAGEWDDLTAWERFGNLLNSQEGDSNLRYWSFRGFDRLEVAVTASGQRVADAAVQLVDSQGETVWEARTDVQGVAYLFADLFEEGQASSSPYKVVVRSGQQEKSMDRILIPDQDVLKVDLGASDSEPSNKADIMFVVDTTGSMQDELNYLEAELKDVVGRVDEQHGNQYELRLGTVFYRDKHDSYVVKPYPFTNDVDRAVAQIADQEANGGGDYPEAVDQALREAVSGQDWTGDRAARLLFLVMDAPPHHEQQHIDEMHSIATEAASQGIRIIPVASSGVDVETEYLMRFLAAATGGTYLFLTDDSGIGGDHLEPAAGEYEVKLLNDLLVEVINRYIGG